MILTNNYVNMSSGRFCISFLLLLQNAAAAYKQYQNNMQNDKAGTGYARGPNYLQARVVSI